MFVKIDGGAVRIRFRDSSDPILAMADRLSLFQNLHDSSLQKDSLAPSEPCVRWDRRSRCEKGAIERSPLRAQALIAVELTRDGLEADYAFGLQALGSLFDFKFHRLPFV